MYLSIQKINIRCFGQRYQIISNFYASFSKNVFKLKIKVKIKMLQCNLQHIMSNVSKPYTLVAQYSIFRIGLLKIRQKNPVGSTEAEKQAVTLSITEIFMDHLENRTVVRGKGVTLPAPIPPLSASRL